MTDYLLPHTHSIAAHALPLWALEEELAAFQLKGEDMRKNAKRKDILTHFPNCHKGITKG